MIELAVIGGGPAGLTAALYAARAGRSVAVFEGSGFGGQITLSPLVENYPGLGAVSGMELGDRMYARTLGLPGEEALVGRGVSYCALCDGPFFDGQDVAVAGGGNTAFEDALFLAERCRSVTLIHRRKTFRAEQALVEQAARQENLAILTDTVITDLCADNGELEHLLLKNADGRETRLPVSGLFVAFGRVPDTEMAAALAERDQEGYFLTNDRMETAAPGFFAAGDCRHKQVRQLTTAVSDGTLAAVSACRWLAEQ